VELSGSRCESWIVNSSHRPDNRIGVLGIEVGEPVIQVAREVASESLPRSAMVHNAMPAYILNRPGKAVVSRVRLAIVQFEHRPHLIEA
jgi:hypothetical protein